MRVVVYYAVRIHCASETEPGSLSIFICQKNQTNPRVNMLPMKQGQVGWVRMIRNDVEYATGLLGVVVLFFFFVGSERANSRIDPADCGGPGRC